jgi:hypothetical protein
VLEQIGQAPLRLGAPRRKIRRDSKVTQECTVRLRSAVLAVGCSAVLIVSIGVPASAAVTLPTKTTTPKKWTHSVCTSLVDWQNQIQQGQNLVSSVQSATDLTEVKDQVVSYLQSTVDTTDQLLTSLAKAGTASVKNGDRIAKEFKKGHQPNSRCLRQCARHYAEP